MKWIDPIVEETRLWRDEYASQFNYNLDAIYEDIKEKEKLHKERIVDFGDNEQDEPQLETTNEKTN